MFPPFSQSVRSFLISLPSLTCRTLWLRMQISPSVSPSLCWHPYPSTTPTQWNANWRKAQQYLLLQFPVFSASLVSFLPCPWFSPFHTPLKGFSRLFTFHFPSSSTLLHYAWPTLGGELCFLPCWENWGPQDRSLQLPLPHPTWPPTISSLSTPISSFLSFSFRRWGPLLPV